MIVFVFFVFVCEGRGLGDSKKAGGDWAKSFELFMVHGGCPGTDNRILDFFVWFIFCPFLIFFCLNYQMVLIWQKKRMFLEVKKLCKRYYISAGMVYEIISSVTNFVVFCFEECWIDCFICYTIKLKHPIKRLLLLMNQWFISI